MKTSQNPNVKAQGFINLRLLDKMEMVLMTVEFARLEDPFLDEWIDLLCKYKHLYPKSGKPCFTLLPSVNQFPIIKSNQL